LKPGLQKGKKVKVKYTLPINFRLGWSHITYSFVKRSACIPILREYIPSANIETSKVS
jgi:hypothetical protein